MQTFNFKLVDGTAVTSSFAIVPINFPNVSSSYLVNGDILTSSVAPTSFNLVPNVFKVELNKGASNNWYISSSTTTTTASAAIVSGSYSTGSLCSVSFNNIDNGHNLDAGKTISIKPVRKNVGFADSFILEDTVYHVTDATGSLVVSLVPQTYSVQYHGNFRTEPYSIYIPNSGSVNAKDCLVTSTNVARVITSKNSADFAYTAQASDARYLSNALTVSSSVSASHALVADSVLGSISSASFAQVSTSSSFATTAGVANSINFVPSVAVSASFASQSLSASWAPAPVSSSFSQTASYVKNGVSSSYAGITNNLKNQWVTALDGGAGNGINVSDADGSSMGITGGGITIIYNPISAISAFEVRDVNNATLSKIDGHGNFVCVNSASVSGSLFGTASFARTASFVNGNSVFGTVTSSSYAVTSSAANSITFVPLTATSASLAATASFYGGSVTSSSFAQTASFAQSSSIAAKAISSSFATTALNLNNPTVTTNGNGLSISDANGSSMGITGAGISIIYNVASAATPFNIRDINNATLSKIDAKGNFVCVNSASVSGSLFGTASYAQTASFVNGANVFGTVTSASWAKTATQLASGSAVIQYDANQNIFYTTVPFEAEGGIWDGANAVVAIVTDDQHALYDSSGNAMLDFSSLGFGSVFGNWTFFNGGITGSLFGTASVARISTNAQTASYVSSSGTVTIQAGSNTTEFRNSASAQTVNIYGAFTNTASFGRLAIGAVGSDMVIESQPQGAASGSGDLLIKHAGNHSVKFFTNGSQRWSVANTGDLLPTGTTLNVGQPGGGVNNLYVTNIIGATNVNATSFTGSLNGTASWSNNALTASYVTSSNVVGTVASSSWALQTVSSSFATTASFIGNSSASLKPTGSFLKMTRNGTVDNSMMWAWENPSSPTQNFWVKAGMALPDVTRWAFTPCDASGFSDYSWAFTFTNNHYTILQGYQNLGSLSIDPSGKTDIYGTAGIELHNDVTIDGNTVQIGAGDFGKILLYDPVNDVMRTITAGDGTIAIPSSDTLDIQGDLQIAGTTNTSDVFISGDLTVTNPVNLKGTVATASAVSPRAWSSISAGAAVTWSAAQTTYADKRTLIVTGPTTMSIQNLYNGFEGSLKVTNGNTGSLLKIVPTPKVINSGSGLISLTNASASVDFIGLQYDGTTLYAAYGNNFN